MYENLKPEDFSKVFSNPYYCLPEIDEVFTQEHEPLVSEEMWIEANANIINELGAKE